MSFSSPNPNPIMYNIFFFFLIFFLCKANDDDDVVVWLLLLMYQGYLKAKTLTLEQRNVEN